MHEGKPLMYTTTVRIPYITTETVTRITQAAPNLGLLLEIPLIVTEVEAEKYAIAVVVKNIKDAPYEYIKSCTSIALDKQNEVWVVSFVIAGD